MSELLHHLRHRILGRMILYVVLPTLLVLGTIIVLSARANWQAMREASEKRLQLQAELIALKIESIHGRVVQSTERMAQAQEAGMFGDRQASLAFARDVLESDDAITGAYFGYEPNADGKDAESLGVLPAESMNSNGRFIPYWFVSNARDRTIVLEPLVDMESSLYYDGAKEEYLKTKKAKPFITEPYVYQGKMIVEQVFPIIIDGEFKGIAGMDIALSDIESLLQSHVKDESDAANGNVKSADCFLISSRGSFIAATTDPIDTGAEATEDLLRTQEVSQTRYDELFSKLTSRPHPKKPVLEDDPTDEARYFFAVADVPTSGWTLVLREAEGLTTGPIWRQLLQRIALALTGVGIIIALLLTISYRLSRRVNLAVEAAEQVANGDLSREIKAGACQDETGILLRSIKKMTSNLNGLIGNVKQASIQLNSTATQLTATSRQQSEAFSSFGASANQIAAAAKEISATTSELVDTMRDVNEVAVGTRDLATAGNARLHDMENNMRELDQATGPIGEKLAVINEKASDITGIVTTITKVADQTNLLSVNAAIEAEKAGEYGVGFLVVAREIRRLADQTAAATLDIGQMVHQMQSAVSAGVMEMDRFTEQVRRSVEDVVQISRQMSQIIERVNTNTEQFERVNESMQSQAQGADQISQAMSQLTSHAQQTSEAIREYAQAGDDLYRAIESLKSSIASFQLKS